MEKTALKHAGNFITTKTPFIAPNLTGRWYGELYAIGSTLLYGDRQHTHSISFYDSRTDVWVISRNEAHHAVNTGRLSRKNYSRRYNLVVDIIKHSGDRWTERPN